MGVLADSLKKGYEMMVGNGIVNRDSLFHGTWGLERTRRRDEMRDHFIEGGSL